MPKVHFQFRIGKQTNGQNTICGIRASRITGIKGSVTCKRCLKVLDQDDSPKEGQRETISSLV